MTTLLDSFLDEGSLPPNYHPALGRGVSVPEEELDDDFELEQEIIDPKNDRFEVPKAHKNGVPFRWICSLKVYFRDPDNPGRVVVFDKGTGSLVSSRHVLTAAHVLYNEITGSRRTKRKQQALRIKVYPGRNGSSKPFGGSGSAAIAYLPKFKPALDIRWDYGLIKLKSALGTKRYKRLGNAQLGYWGSAGSKTFVKPLKRSYLQNKIVNVSGYPTSKRHVQWMAFDRIVDSTPTAGKHKLNELIAHVADTSDGQSGGPIWRYSKKTKKRYLVAVHHGACIPAIDGCRPPGSRKVASNLGVLLTSDVLRQIERWKETM